MCPNIIPNHLFGERRFNATASTSGPTPPTHSTTRPPFPPRLPRQLSTPPIGRIGFDRSGRGLLIGRPPGTSGDPGPCVWRGRRLKGQRVSADTRAQRQDPSTGRGDESTRTQREPRAMPVEAGLHRVKLFFQRPGSARRRHRGSGGVRSSTETNKLKVDGRRIRTLNAAAAPKPLIPPETPPQISHRVFPLLSL